jgi:hypothetical protein
MRNMRRHRDRRKVLHFVCELGESTSAQGMTGVALAQKMEVSKYLHFGQNEFEFMNENSERG